MNSLAVLTLGLTIHLLIFSQLNSEPLDDEGQTSGLSNWEYEGLAAPQGEEHIIRKRDANGTDVGNSTEVVNTTKVETKPACVAKGHYCYDSGLPCCEGLKCKIKGHHGSHSCKT